MPDDFGLICMVATLTTLLQTFTDMGLSWATIGSEKLTLGQVDTLFWVNAAVGVLLWGVCVLIAPLVALLYGRGELTSLSIVVASSFAVSGLVVQPIALLTRQMLFQRIFFVEFGALAVGATVAIALAYEGPVTGRWPLKSLPCSSDVCS